MAGRHPPVIVHPPSSSGGRRITVHGQIVGLAHGRGDLCEMLRAAGLDPKAFDLDDPTVIEWRGGGLDHWPRPAA
jgi:hypothetical protein